MTPAVRPEHFVELRYYAAWRSGAPLRRDCEPGGRHSRGKPTRRVRDLVYARDAFRCVLCGNAANLSVDHHPVPWILGGAAHPHNLRTLCTRCNSAAGHAHARAAALASAAAPSTTPPVPLEW